MLGVQLTNQVFDIEFLAKAGIEFRQPGFDIRAKARQVVDALKQVAAQSLLRRLGEVSRFRDG